MAHMKHLVKIIIPILFIGSMLVSIPACDLYTQIDEDTLIILAAIFTSITLIVLITWLILHRRINAKLDKLLTLSLKHFPEQKTNLKHYDTCPKKLSKLIESFMQASKEIEKRETELLRSNEFTTSILNNISDAVCVLEPKEFRIVAVNPAFLKMHNIKLREAIGKDCHSVAHCKDLNGNYLCHQRQPNS
ncbi:MAG: hypothetical protein B6I36_08545 [Desulfobacteraceae bacterium 4572_35.1]|nr:MAG: hypothetical protein B6I36_08545 [Desulfobacteraceae bacterium 4572_35.1]